MKNIQLKKLRKDKKLTQKDMANLLEIDVSTYTKKENGQIAFSLKEVYLMKNAFNIKDSELVKIFFGNLRELNSLITTQ